MAEKAIITCAITGSIHTPSMSPHLPVTAQEIADAAVEAVEAGAALIHLHARNPVDGRPDQSPEAFRPFLENIKQRTNCVMNITTGGGPGMPLDERLLPCTVFKPEVASLNMGSMNFGLYEMLRRYPKDSLKHKWEYELLEGSRDRVFKNTFTDIEYILTTCRENGTRFEVECYDIGHLYTLAHFAERKIIEPPFFVQSVFGILGGIAGHPEDVMMMKRTADRLFGKDYHWSVLGGGRNQMQIAAIGAAMGANVRVGLEDSLWDGPGKLAQSNGAAGQTRAPDHRRHGPRDCHARRGARDAQAQGRRPHRFLELFRPPDLEDAAGARHRAIGSDDDRVAIARAPSRVAAAATGFRSIRRAARPADSRWSGPWSWNRLRLWPRC